MKKNKKICCIITFIIVSLLLIVSVCAIFGCSDCCLNYDEENCVDRINLYYGKWSNGCFVGALEYNKGESTTFVIPEKHANKTVDKLGGFYGTGVPTPFQICIIEDGFFPTDNEVFCYDEDVVNGYQERGWLIEYWDINFTIILPSKLREIQRVFNCFLCQRNGETLVVLRGLYNFEISPENEYFYTIKGKLYDKKTQLVVDKFLYTVDYS